MRHYGRRGPFRGPRCKICQYADICDFHFDMGRDPWLDTLYEAPSREDGYFRDQCVFREEIDIPDTMTAAIRYDNGVQVAYSLNTFMPIEGHHLAFNGTRGRIEIRQYERQAWETPDADEILVASNFGPAERISRAAPRWRAFRRRSGDAENALRAGRRRPARAAGGIARRRDVGALRRGGDGERAVGKAGQGEADAGEIAGPSRLDFYISPRSVRGEQTTEKPVIFTISVPWDEEASVWTGHCDDIPAAADQLPILPIFTLSFKKSSSGCGF